MTVRVSWAQFDVRAPRKHLRVAWAELDVRAPTWRPDLDWEDSEISGFAHYHNLSLNQYLIPVDGEEADEEQIILALLMEIATHVV